MDIEFAKERETKNTVRFTEQSDAPVIGTLYIQRLALKQMGYVDGNVIKITLQNVQTQEE